MSPRAHLERVFVYEYSNQKRHLCVRYLVVLQFALLRGRLYNRIASAHFARACFLKDIVPLHSRARKNGTAMCRDNTLREMKYVRTKSSLNRHPVSLKTILMSHRERTSYVNGTI